MPSVTTIPTAPEPKRPKKLEFDADVDFNSVPDSLPTSLRMRRQSNVNIDAIHELPEDGTQAPGQLYATESGRLFHSGKIAIVTVGLPARGKTHITVALSRFLRWLGVICRTFHLGDYRRAFMGPGKDVPDDYFFVNPSPKTRDLRAEIVSQCREDLYHFFDNEHGQVAIYDAVNPVEGGRRKLEHEFAEHNIQTIFIESSVTDPKIIEENVRHVKISSPDYEGWAPDAAIAHYIKRMEAKIPHFETISEREKDLHYIKMIDAGKRLIVNNCRFGYLPNRIVYYLINLHIKSRQTYFARAGFSTEYDSYKADASLSDDGRAYASRLADTLLAHRIKEREENIARGGSDAPLRPLSVWTSTRRRTMQTAEYLGDKGITVKQRAQLSQLNPGAVEGMTDEEIRNEYPDAWAQHQIDPYHHRYPRGESYHDLAVRLEPIILELERTQSDLLIIAHESVLRVLYSYMMSCSTMDIPSLSFPRHEIVEVIPSSYNNQATRIRIPETDPLGHYAPGEGLNGETN